jgi:hypothetical protein
MLRGSRSGGRLRFRLHSCSRTGGRGRRRGRPTATVTTAAAAAAGATPPATTTATTPTTAATTAADHFAASVGAAAAAILLAAALDGGRRIRLAAALTGRGCSTRSCRSNGSKEVRLNSGKLLIYYAGEQRRERLDDHGSVIEKLRNKKFLRQHHAGHHGNNASTIDISTSSRGAISASGSLRQGGVIVFFRLF